jgi:serine/threonine protein kinase/tetratricopeptide (TPR) repeat protein
MQPDDDKTQAVTMLSKGTVVGHYLIVEKIGAGGMGEVYLAEDTELNRQVALKFLSSHLCQDADCRTRFKREAQAAAKLNHPNIVTIYEVSEFNGRPFFAMELVERQSLRELIKAKELPIERVIELAIQICEGLNKAHQAGIVHRDVKPANILIDADGRARILDFGLAAVQGSDHLTKTGSTLGTIGYMSPEQVRGEQVDHRTDIFSLGVVLYELITGRQPFKSDNDAATSRKITESETEPLARYKAGVSEELQRIVSKALAKDKVLRYQHADELLADLRHVAGIALDSGVHIAKLPMLAVLPFDNLGPADQEYFADGMTEEIIMQLAKQKELGVISRTSVMRYKGVRRDLREISAELGVDYVVEGSVLWAQSAGASRVRINAQLIKSSDDTHLWADRFDRNFEDIFLIHSDIAQRVANALSAALGRSESSIPPEILTKNIDAYDYYLRGLRFISRDRQTTLKGIDMFEKATKLDPGFVRAHRELAGQHAILRFWNYDQSQERLGKAKDALEKVMLLAPNSLDAHVAQGDYCYFGIRDYDRALEHYVAARQLEPGNKKLGYRIGLIKRRQGRLDEAISLQVEDVIFDPLNGLAQSELGTTFLLAKDYRKAEEHFRRAIILRPDIVSLHIRLAELLIVWRGDLGKARDVLLQAPSHLDFSDQLCYLDLLEGNWRAADDHLPKSVQEAWDDVTPEYYWKKAWVNHLAGNTPAEMDYFNLLLKHGEASIMKNPDMYSNYTDVARANVGLGKRDDAVRFGKKAAEMMPLSRDYLTGADVLYNLALVYALVGEVDAAIECLDKLLCATGRYSAHIIRLEPYWSALRQSPRYEWLLKKHAT